MNTIGKAHNHRLCETVPLLAKTATEFLILRTYRGRTKQVWVSRADWSQV